MEDEAMNRQKLERDPDADADAGTEGGVADEVKPVGGGERGWGGWGFSSLSILSDLQKAAGEISRNKSLYDAKLKEVQQIFDINQEINGVASETGKGKKVEATSEGNDDEIRSLHNSSVNKAAEMASGFMNAISGLPTGEMIQRTTNRLEALHSEGVHRLWEMCCFAVSQLLMLGKSIISNGNGAKDENDADLMEIEWPEDSAGRAKIIRTRAQSTARYAKSISPSFVTGISDVAEAYLAAMKGFAANSEEVPSKASIQEKANAFQNISRAVRPPRWARSRMGCSTYLSLLSHVPCLPFDHDSPPQVFPLKPNRGVCK